MNNCTSSPADRLHDEFTAATQLLELLSEEQSFLIKADVDQLAVLSEEKTRLVAHMSELALRRHTALGAMGLPASEAGMQVWLQDRRASQSAGKTWDELLDTAAKAKELNRVNGLLIGQHLARNQQALNVLQGNQPAGPIYGRNGQTTSTASTRRLVVG